MSRWMRASIVAAGVVSATGCVMGTGAGSVYGRPAIVMPSGESRRPAMTGELIAASSDSLWVLADSGLASLPLAAADHVRVQRHNFGGGKGLVWTLIGGVVTGGALTSACSSVQGDCGGVFVAVAVMWGLVGGVSSLSLEASSKTTIAGPPWEGLRPYARYPQGLPDSLDRAALRPRPKPGPARVP
ncbi:MAG: hypothetical protein HYS40_01670 [Gemmatimonadetes bacterium]|nr:hypothetical protein [Gemmatimonadota bacterium]